jgi:hypothetical protein
MSTPGRGGLLDLHRESLAAFEAATAGLGQDQLDSSAAPGEWSVRQIIHHVADTEIIAGARLRLILAEDGVAVPSYDQEELARAADPGSRSVEASLALVGAIHQANVELMTALVPSAWDRAGFHPEIGRYTVDEWLERRARHLRGHAEQIILARDG